MNTKQFLKKSLNDSKDINISYDFVNIPRNQNFTNIKHSSNTSTQELQIMNSKDSSFWTSKKKFELLKKQALSRNWYRLLKSFKRSLSFLYIWWDNLWTLL